MCVQNWTNFGAHKPLLQSGTEVIFLLLEGLIPEILDFCTLQNTSRAEHTRRRGKAAHPSPHLNTK